MPTRDLHTKPFDAGTKTKLSIYRGYIRAWLQVFLHTDVFHGKPLQFFDLFCGPGEDSVGQPGSPLILIQELIAQQASIQERGYEVRIFFNDNDSAKIENLNRLCTERAIPWQPRLASLDFSEAFAQIRSDIGKGPSLVFIDQNGVKHLTKAVFDTLTKAATTDFIFFVASSFKWRFGELLAPEIQFPENIPYFEVHRVLADKYREWAPRNMFIGHFSIMKERNIYGLVFGSHHWRGMQKFLEIAWKMDGECGEANYEMERDMLQGEMYFDTGKTGFKKRKIEVFQDKLAASIKSGELATDQAVFLHCLINGFRPSVAKNVYAQLGADDLLKNSRRDYPRYSAAVMKEPRRIRI